MKDENKKIILLGIGNCGREDDGLGWAFLDKIKPNLPKNYNIEYRYQLQVEDAELVARYDSVFFIDAFKNKTKDGFFIKKCLPKETHNFTSHSQNPETILYLAKSIYNKEPNAFIVGISGESFQLKMGLTDSASTNLEKSVSFFKENHLPTKKIANKYQL